MSFRGGDGQFPQVGKPAHGTALMNAFAERLSPTRYAFEEKHL